MKLDPPTALIVIALQAGIRTLTLISIFRARKLSSVLTNVDGLASGQTSGLRAHSLQAGSN